MSIPSTITQLLVTLVLVVPGFVYQTVRIRLSGRTPADEELAGRVLRAIAISTTFALGYFVALGPQLTDAIQATGQVLDHPRRAALLGLAGAVVLPSLLAALPVVPRVKDVLKAAPKGFRSKLRALATVGSWTQYDPRPAAWDVAFATAEIGWFVRVKMKDGTWFAGYWGVKSWASSFPDPHSVFVEAEYQVDDDGTIGDEVNGTQGAIIQCGDAVLVELLRADAPEVGFDVGTEVI